MCHRAFSTDLAQDMVLAVPGALSSQLKRPVWGCFVAKVHIRLEPLPNITGTRCAMMLGGSASTQSLGRGFWGSGKHFLISLFSGNVSHLQGLNLCRVLH